MDQLSAAVALLPGNGISTVELYMAWEAIRAPLIAPLLRFLIVICTTLSIVQFVERIYMGVVIILVKLLGRTPEKRFKWEAMKDDSELGSSAYPMVLVQIPMFNEKEVLWLCFSCSVFPPL